ncbi:unnamed protein product [Effrenium voratum]|nr:unnamed protein product [Effrenium voratum]
MPTTLMRRIEKEPGLARQEEDDTWQQCLTSTERMQIHLARAFISNPHVLVLHKPLMRFYNEKLRLAVMGVIRDFVDNRGLSLPAANEQSAKRRARTVIMSAFHAIEIEGADVLFELGNKTIKEVSKTELKQGVTRIL